MMNLHKAECGMLNAEVKAEVEKAEIHFFIGGFSAFTSAFTSAFNLQHSALP
jgi:hypothetical protein